MSGPGRGLLRSACGVFALGLVGLLLFGVSQAGADPPVFDPVSDQTLEATSSAGAVATFTVTAVDNDVPPNPVSISCDHNSGATFPIGATPVLCTATDTATGEVTGPVLVLTITVQDTTAPTITTPGNITAEATSVGGTTVTYSTSATDIVDGSVTPVCAPPSGSTFVLATTTTVNCTATDSHGNSASASFNVSVVDTTPPTLGAMPANITTAATGPSGAVVSYALPTATDTVDGIPTVTCAPPSGTTFPVGTTTVSCTASDHSGNTSPPQTFQVSVTDTVKPTLTNMPGNQTVAATGPGGAAVSYSMPGATDNVDPNPSVSCSPPPGSTFPVGTSTVTCTATDSSGNKDVQSFTITVSDTTPPTINASNVGPIEATGPGGAAVSFNVTASDNIDPSPTVSCSPPSGSTFPLGSTTVNCTAKDSANNQSSASFTVAVGDTTPPAFANVPSLPTLEAINAGGSAVSYVAPTAVDLVSGAVPVACSPPSGSGFPIGTTTVDCQAHDASGNIGHAVFSITVADRTPPVISGPPSLTIYATTPTGVPASDPSVAAADRLVTAQDNIDPSPVVTSDMPDFLPLGHTLVHFFASDRYGNRSGTNMDVNVIPKPPTGTPPPLPPPDATPPANVTNLSARGGDRSVALTWKLPTDKDLDHVGVYRSEPTAAGLGTPVYSGPAAKFTDKGLTNDTQYRYVVVTYDKAGNRSVGLAILATPHVLKLLRPLDGAVVKKPPVFVWRANAEADYYNLQLFKDSGKALAGSLSDSAVKILSVWPKKTRFALKAQWKFQGRKYKLTKGTYRWFVWPGFGSRTENSYGTLLGENTFKVTR